MSFLGRALPLRPAPPNRHDGDTPFYRVTVHKIPADATEREVRKVIGRKLYKLQREPLIKFHIELPRTGSQTFGHITFTDTRHAQAWMDKYGDQNSLYPVTMGQTRLRFVRNNSYVDPFRLEAIAESNNGGENDSDYDEDGEGVDQPTCLSISRLECGDFNDDGQYCIGWSKTASSPFSGVCFDVDEARLRIRCDGLVVQASTYDLQYIYSSDRNLYFEFKQAPMCLVDESSMQKASDSLAWLDSAPPTFARVHEQYHRVPYFDDKHARCVQYGTVYRVQMCQAKMLLPYLKRTKGRLFLRARVKEHPDNDDAAAFDSSGFHALLEKLNYVVAFQAQALTGHNRLLPGEVASLRSEMMSLQKRLGSIEAAAVLCSLKSDLLPRSPVSRLHRPRQLTMKQIRERLKCASLPKKSTHKNPRVMMIHSAFITPCFGLKLEGPHADEGNRILRAYPGQDENFIRVHLTEEDGSAFRVVHDWGTIDAERLMHDRFGDALRNGITVGGRRFRFLAFSGSSLREHSCWFVRSFRFGKDKVKVTASSIRDSIGDLQHIRSPARYAARMGQAFTATSTSIAVSASYVKQVDDIKSKCGRYEFSDGVGTMSQLICNRMNRAIFTSSDQIPVVPPSAFQIRMGGAKGMLSLDTRLEGEEVILRKSMVKFATQSIAGVTPLEVAHYYTKPVPMFLNRPMVALLESLGVDADVFVKLQDDAVKALGLATRSHESAIALLHRSGVGRGCNFEGILRAMGGIGINALTEIPFLHDANISLVDFALRNIKYRARVRVPHCHTLVGVMDEFNILAENQVIACINEGGNVRYLRGRCLLGRSPMLAPGDVQYAQAIEPKKGHPLCALTNVIIFSQKGDRPLPSMLSGGDLDGDLFNIIQHPDLMPEFTCPPARYDKSSMLELPRPCVIDDVVDFFLDYIKLDKLGLIATRHLEISDRSKDGVLDPDCLILAAMHSIAVDFPKTGSLPEIRQLPKAPRQKPDYRKPEFRNEDRREDSMKKHPRSKDVYYPSQKALGKMFREIDVFKQTSEWDQGSREERDGCMERIWQFLTQRGRGSLWKSLVKQQTNTVEEYYSRMWVIAQEHCPDEKGSHLDEEEVFMGHIICRGPDGSRLSRFDATNRLQDDFQLVCQDIRQRSLFDPVMLEGDEELRMRAIWLLTMTHVGQRITENDLIKLQIQKGEDLLELQAQLDQVLERGLAWVRAAFDHEDPKKGRSAPWVVIPALVTVHTCLDVLEALLRNNTGVARGKEAYSGNQTNAATDYDSDDDCSRSSDTRDSGRCSEQGSERIKTGESTPVYEQGSKGAVQWER